MSDWYKKRFRRTLLDMHIEDWSDEFLSEYDPELYFNALKKAQITAPMIYVQSHVGLCYWPTKSGVIHRAFIGKEDQIKRLFDLCHQDGMDVVLYYSIIFNNREYDRHPSWRMLDYEGLGSREHGMRYGLCCPNNKEYQEFTKRQIQEFSEYFDFEGVFFDMTFWPEVCYCDSCKKRWREEHGGELPYIVDWNDTIWNEFDKKRKEWLGEFAQMITDEAKKNKPGITVEHQYSASMHYWRFGNNENISKASDYIGTDLYGGIKQQSFACKAWYNLTQNQPFQYMTSRCYPALTEHTTNKSYDQLKQCVAMTFLHHGASMLIDAIDPVGTIDERVYDEIGDIYGEMKAYEPYLDQGKMAYDVSLFLNMNGKMNVEANGLHIMDHKLDRGTKEAGTMPHMDAMMGAQEAFINHHIPYGVMNQWKKEEMNEHPVLVLADVPAMSKEELDMVKDYIKNGGNVYMSGHSASGLWEELLGLTMEGYTNETVTYIAPAESNDFMKKYFTEKYPLVMFEKAVIVSGTVKGKILATLTLPYTVPVFYSDICPTEMFEDQYIKKDSPQYPFSTIHANPPGIQTDYPALVEAEYGKGKVIWSALPIERAKRYQHKKIFANIITYLGGGCFKHGMEAPETVEGVMFEEENEGNCLFGIIETSETFKIPTNYHMDFWVRSKRKPKSVVSLPDEIEIPFIYEENKVKVHVDRMDIFHMYKISY